MKATSFDFQKSYANLDFIDSFNNQNIFGHYSQQQLFKTGENLLRTNYLFNNSLNKNNNFEFIKQNLQSNSFKIQNNLNQFNQQNALRLKNSKYQKHYFKTFLVSNDFNKPNQSSFQQQEQQQQNNFSSNSYFQQQQQQQSSYDESLLKDEYFDLEKASKLDLDENIDISHLEKKAMQIPSINEFSKQTTELKINVDNYYKKINCVDEYEKGLLKFIESWKNKKEIEQLKKVCTMQLQKQFGEGFNQFTDKEREGVLIDCIFQAKTQFLMELQQSLKIQGDQLGKCLEAAQPFKPQF